MSDIIISLFEESDAQKLFTFELKNKAFFERVGFPREDNYYELNNFNTIIKELIEEQEKGLVYMYLIKNHTGMILGRINLLSIVRGSFNKAELVYRIDEGHQGNGVIAYILKEYLIRYMLSNNIHTDVPKSISLSTDTVNHIISK